MKLFSLFILASLLASTLSMADPADSKDTLRGLSHVFLVISPINDDATKDGLTAAHIRTIVEPILNQAGIPLTKDPQQKDGYANLVVNINTIKNPQGVYVFTVSIDLVQTVQLTRNAKTAPFPAQTWGTESLGLTTPQRFDIIDGSVKDKLGEFVEAFKAMNKR